MRIRKRQFILILLLLCVILIATGGCASGRDSRREVNKAIDSTGDWVSDFCGASSLPLAAIGVVLLSTQRARRK